MKDNIIGIIIQARLGSTRFPKKILKEIEGQPLIIFLIERLRLLELPIFVATTTNPIDDELCEVLDDHQIDYHRGSETDVLSRYIGTAEHFQLDDIVRICSDNPLIDITLLKDLVTKWEKMIGVDYFSYSYQNRPTILSHFGVFGEVFTLKAIKSLIQNFEDPKYNEHVTYGLYSNPDTYQIRMQAVDGQFDGYQGMRLTVDTQSDYENLLKLSQKVCLKAVSTEEIFYVVNLNSEMLNEMKIVIANNQKS